MNTSDMTPHDEQHHVHAWQVALQATLADAIEHLQVLIFDEGWEAMRVATGSNEEALRESVARYERELARLFRFLRVSGALPNAVAWSTLKAEYRRASLDAETEISLRTALESGFYAAEPVPLGNHATYLHWSSALRGFLIALVPGSTGRPAPTASEDERLEWAYDTLASLEDHDTFSTAFIAWLDAGSSDWSVVRDIIDLHDRVLVLPRFDLVLNTSLRWLAASVSD